MKRLPILVLRWRCNGRSLSTGWRKCGKQKITELPLLISSMNSKVPDRRISGNSFDPIIAYGAHGAILSITVQQKTNIHWSLKGWFWWMGAQDIIWRALFDITPPLYLARLLRKKKNISQQYSVDTWTWQQQIRYGCTGLNLDALARGPLWAMGEDYNHRNRPWRRLSSQCTRRTAELPAGKALPPWASGPVLEEGDDHLRWTGILQEMIRHPSRKSCSLQKLKNILRPVYEIWATDLVPFDLEAYRIRDRWKQESANYSNQYHALVYEKISPYLNEEEQSG